MSKCRYDLSEDCNNMDCLNCMLDKIKVEIKEHTKRYSLSSEQNCLGTVLWSKYMISFDDVIAIIDKHLQEVTTDADHD